MNILVIGNGFDLAHGLPTKYTDFLHFVQVYEECYTKEIINRNKIVADSDIKKYIRGLFDLKYNNTDLIEDMNNKPKRENAKKLIKELYDYIKDNFWIDYFLQCDMHGDENWIDFESEISSVIKSIDRDVKHYLQEIYSLDDEVDYFSNSYLEKKYEEYIGINRSIDKCLNGTDKVITYRDIRNMLYKDLNKLIRVFEIYLTEYIEKIDCKWISPDIQKILPKESVKVNGISVYDTMLLSFNYTNTYQRLYMGNVDRNFEWNIDYIHGKADINNTIESNNMVLGIDEYLPEDRKNKDIEFIAFKKYYQRIHKQTGCKYKKWVDQIKDGWKNETEESKEEIRKCIDRGDLRNPKIHKLYIFGHSLDDTDKDVLKDFILNDNVYTTIFYYNKEAMGQQIANLVKVIGQDELIRRTGGRTKTIEFRQQKDMITIK